MKEEVTISEGLSCSVLNCWKENAARFPLIAKAAKIVLGIPQHLRQYASVFQASQAHRNNRYNGATS